MSNIYVSIIIFCLVFSLLFGATYWHDHKNVDRPVLHLLPITLKNDIRPINFRQLEKAIINYHQARTYTVQAILRFDADMQRFLASHSYILDYSDREIEALLIHTLGFGLDDQLQATKETLKHYLVIKRSQMDGGVDMRSVPHPLREEFKLLLKSISSYD